MENRGAARLWPPARGALALLLILVGVGCGGRASTGPGPDAAADAGCTDECNAAGSAECATGGGSRYVCTVGPQGCLVRQVEICAGTRTCVDGACLPCEGAAGTYPAQVLPHDGEDRYYYLYVPGGYACSDPWPLLVDLHGTAGPPRPEEAYGLTGARQAADDLGYLLLRPRSRSSTEAGGEVYRWDQNPGDPDRNRRFLNALVADLGERYHLAADRRYLMGFSSGTNQTAEAFADIASPFSGYGFVGGGAWTVSSLATPTGPGPRVYLNSGFRDYMRTYHLELVALLRAAGIPESSWLDRETDAGHELYAWMYPELFAFLDAGVRPAPGQLSAGWAAETSGSDRALLALEPLPDGSLLAVGEEEALLRREPGGTWSALTPGATSAFPGRAFTAACATPDGTALAVGGGQLARSTDGGQTWSHQPAVADLSLSGFGYSYWNTVACAPGRAVAAGYWSGATSDSGGAGWADLLFDAGGYRAQVAAVRRAGWSTWVAVGYWGYAARSADGATWSRATFSPHADWVTDAAAAPTATGRWIMVGEGGHIWRSTDDAATFTSTHSGGPDLYATRFRDDTTALAVGRAGAALLSTDGGASWTDVSAGVDRMLAAVAWLPDGTALVVGEGGTALRFDPTAR